MISALTFNVVGHRQNNIKNQYKSFMMTSKRSLASTIATALLVLGTTAMAQSANPGAAANETTPTGVVTAPTAKKWTCTADSLADFRYDGSGWAYIRPSAYSSGGQYRVTKDETGDIAKGFTQDRTPFVCSTK